MGGFGVLVMSGERRPLSSPGFLPNTGRMFVSRTWENCWR